MQRAVVALGVLLALLALVRVADKADQGKQAVLKWAPQLEALLDGRDPYERSDSGLVRTEAAAEGAASAEGFPTPPVSGLVLAPFARLGGVPGAVAFAALKVALAAFALAVCLRAAFAPRPVPPLAALIVLLGCARVWSSDLAHGNTNLLVLGAVAAALLAWWRRMEALAGLWIALAAGLKVTPLLLLVLPLARRSRDGVVGFAAGLVLFGVAVPGAVLGVGPALELLGSWGRQMLVPYLEGRAPTLLLTEHTNQSLLGLLARLLTDSVAIEARPGVWDADRSVALAHLSEGTLHLVHRALGLVVVALTAWRVRRPEHGTLPAFAAIAMAMLLLSERSWKQHFVLLVLPLAHLVAVAWCERGARRTGAVVALAAALALVGLSGSGLLGEHGSDLAEAYGAFTAAALVLWAACLALPRPDYRGGDAADPGSR